MRRYSATQLTRAQLSADCLPHSKPRVCLGTLRMRFSTTTPAARVSDRFLHRGKETGRLVKIASESEVAWVGRKQKKKTPKKGCVAGLSKNLISLPGGMKEWISQQVPTTSLLLNLLTRSFSVPTIDKKPLIYINS